MLYENRKCESDMGTDNTVNFGGCSKAKKAKPSENGKDIYIPCWDHLPAVVMHDIFDLLSKEDRKNASTVCKNWRHNIFHPKWWPEITFKIEQNEMLKAQFYTNTFGHIVSDATIRISSLSPACVREFVVLLQTLSENNNLKSIAIEPSHCRLEVPIKRIEESNENDLLDVVNALLACLPKLSKFSIGCLEDLSYILSDILKKLDPAKVTHLCLASVKDDPIKYQQIYLDPKLLIPFEKLKVLSVDYDHVSDAFLGTLDKCRKLQRLVVHLHSVRPAHPGTTNAAWQRFSELHPGCEMRLTIIHAFDDIDNLHNLVLRRSMPLSHIKVFFCESVNLHVLESLSSYYPETLRSVMWIDSLSDNKGSWKFAEPQYDQSPDPFVLMAWLCKRLEEVVLYGYKYCELNLMAIGRLRGSELKNLEIAEDDILFSDNVNTSFLIDIPKNMGKPWKPVKSSELHPVICNPVAGDSDEYLLPIVLADIQ
ncbi:unnamed protein product [Brassicogethes aeneus]|uniref:F-box domain-containing protein n=1 Tax=Brassicogethes aeneus TaxID=1431903 RepID=A0A9P0FCN8_BRAAE|nr:unnamed protein product [Brassicogethes aeneus]